LKVLYDSNVLTKYLAGDEKARTLVEKVINDEWRGYITGAIASEPAHITSSQKLFASETLHHI